MPENNPLHTENAGAEYLKFRRGFEGLLDRSVPGNAPMW